MSGQKVKFHIGNTYRKILGREAKEAGPYRKKKVHHWQLFVEVTSCPETILSVRFTFADSFFPNTVVCLLPVQVRGNDGRTRWIFATRQQSYAMVEATILISFRDGRTKSFGHRVKCHRCRSKQKFHKEQPIPKQFLPPGQRYGIELELTSMKEKEDICEALRHHLGHSIDSWKLERDTSIECSRNQPNCNKFELVSPKLQGEEGLSRISEVLRTLRQNDVDIKINKSMGFHVHVEVADLSQQQLNRVCQNFVNFEDVFDSLVPPSRRSGSEESNRYFRSNANALPWTSNRQRHGLLRICHNIVVLANVMNPGGRYYKLNLQNLVTKKQETLEFRQHSSTTDFAKISNWIRLCIQFVISSKENRGLIKCFGNPGPSLEVKTDIFFRTLIQNPSLYDFYRKRQEELKHLDEDCCCNDCKLGGQCGQLAPRRHGVK
jgi:hypothetical protein